MGAGYPDPWDTPAPAGAADRAIVGSVGADDAEQPDEPRRTREHRVAVGVEIRAPIEVVWELVCQLHR